MAGRESVAQADVGRDGMASLWDQTKPSRATSKPVRVGGGRYDPRLDLLVPVAQECAKARGKAGVIMADVRQAAERRGLLMKAVKGSGRVLSYLSGLMGRSGLVGTDLFRRSGLDGQNGIPQRVWVLPEHYDPILHETPVLALDREAAR